MFERLFLKMEGDNGGTGGGGGGAPENIGTGGNPQGGAAGGGNALPGANSGNAGGATNWIESLPDDIKKDPSLQNFKDPASLAKSWVNAQKMIGADKVIIPGEKATAEEIASFHAKLGRPGKSEEYKFELPENYKLHPVLEKGLRETAFAAGLSSKQAAQLVSWYAKTEPELMQANETAQKQQIVDSINEYKKTLGGDDKYKAQVDKARTAVAALADDKLKKFLVDTQLGSKPEMIEHFAKLADMMGEDKIADGNGTPMPSHDLESMQREINDIEGMKGYWDGSLPNQDAMNTRRTDLYKRMEAIRSKMK